jgi:hypothetical protein
MALTPAIFVHLFFLPTERVCGMRRIGSAAAPRFLSTWHNIMGPWPALIDKPRVETIKTTQRENILQHQLRVQIALGG